MKQRQIHKKQKPKLKIDEIALVFVVAVIVMLVSIYGKMSKGNEPKMEAEKITEILLDEHAVSFANNGIVDGNRLKEIRNMNYNDFKKSLNAKNDFCIYIEDGSGNIILAKGSSKLNGDGMNCRE
ncbi:hypothetical protein HYX04_03245 [Candidatus Woesearchaeota archaeon]|nr:hypothetical protein [Candidatus Woesearchaeota archaeon]